MAFVSIIDLAGYLDSEISDMNPWLAEFAIRVAEETVLGIIGSDVSFVEDDDITVNGSGTDALVLRYVDIADVTDVSVDGEAVDEANYTLAPTRILYRTDGGIWPRGRGNIALTLTHGWGEIGSDRGNEVAMVVREAALSYAKDIYQAGSAPPPDIASETLGAYSYTVNAASAAAAAASSRLADLRAKLAAWTDVRL
jgi:hypothetical protein